MLDYLTQKAIVAFLSNAGLTTVSNFYRGINNTDDPASSTPEATRQLPSVTVEANNGVPYAPHALNRKVSATIWIESGQHASTDAQHFTRVQEVNSKIDTNTIAADLSAAIPNYTAELVVQTGNGWSEGGNTWKSYIKLDVWCASAVLT